MNRSTDPDEDEGEYVDAEEYLPPPLMDEKWFVIFKAYCADHNRQQGLEMDDLAAELRLRGLDPPFEAVKTEISKLQGALKRIGPHASSPKFGQKVSEFLEERSKPKH